MPPAYGPPGQKIVVTGLAETPLEALESCLELREQLPPEPATLAPTDVVIAVRAAAVGWVDLLMTSGQYQHLVRPPYTPGLEYAGEIVWCGAEVDPARLGTRVLADGFSTGPRSGGEHRRHGGFASYAVAPDKAALALPEPLSFAEGCALLGSYETAYHCLIACGELRAEDTVLIHGASGATGLAAVHVAKRVGATVIATGRSPEKLAAVRAEGADHVLCTATEDGEPRFRDEVKALTGGRGVDVVYDGVGGAVSLESLRCVRFGARFLIVGWASTPFVARGKGQRGAPRANQLPTNLLMMKGLRVLGCPTVIATQHDPGLRPARLRWIFDQVRAGLRPCVGRRFPLARYDEALRAKWNSAFVGGCVLEP